ncbi:hypothetical protein G7046_g9225 [Stylonectria norvegica]|nr:hypothetical protein G7046_g9225 [Stylonectria norvegica]
MRHGAAAPVSPTALPPPNHIHGHTHGHGHHHDDHHHSGYFHLHDREPSTQLLNSSSTDRRHLLATNFPRLQPSASRFQPSPLLRFQPYHAPNVASPPPHLTLTFRPSRLPTRILPALLRALAFASAFALDVCLSDFPASRL